MAECHEILEKHGEDWSFDSHWDRRPRKREWMGVLSRIESNACKCASFVADQNAQGTSDRLFDLAREFEQRQHAFENIRDNFVDIVVGEQSGINTVVGVLEVCDA